VPETLVRALDRLYHCWNYVLARWQQMQQQKLVRWVKAGNCIEC